MINQTLKKFMRKDVEKYSHDSFDAHVFSIYHHTLRSQFRFILLHVLKMADAMQAFNNVPPPPGPPVDANSAFADALKRAKEVLMLLRSS